MIYGSIVLTEAGKAARLASAGAQLLRAGLQGEIYKTAGDRWVAAKQSRRGVWVLTEADCDCFR